MREPSLMQRLVFGESVKLHEVTGLPIETGIGALPPDTQAWLQCGLIDKRHGKAAGDAMRKKLTDVKNMKAAQTGLAAAQAEVKADGIGRRAAAVTALEFFLNEISCSAVV